MLCLKRIMSPEMPEFRKLIRLYEEAFPKEERREVSQLSELLQQEPAMYFNAIESEGELAGLFVYWNFGDFYYLEHLAVFADMRNRKIGQQLLDWVRIHLQGDRLLEVEPAGKEMAERRIKYYERNGYRIVKKDYLQPPYDGKRKDLPLWIMANSSYEDPALLDRHIQVIRKRVYRLEL